MIAAKREAFHNEIRNKQVQQMMAKVRVQFSKEHRVYALQMLIGATQ